MAFLSPIVDLKDTFLEEYWDWVIPALLHDPLVWRALQNPDFREKAIREIGNKPRGWSPMNLACLLMGESITIKHLKSTPLESLPASLTQRVLQTFDHYSASPSSPMDLEQAGLLAIYFFKDPTPLHHFSWETAVTCLYELVSNKFDFIFDLPVHLTVNVLLSNPIPVDELKILITRLITQYPQEKKADLLQELSIQRPDLAALATSQSNADASQPIAYYAQLDPDSNLKKLPKLITQAEIQNIAGNTQDAIPFLIEAWHESQNLQAALNFKVIQHKILAGDIKGALELWRDSQSRLLGYNPEYIAEILLSLVSQGATDVLDAFPAERIDPRQNPASAVIWLAQGFLQYYLDRQDQALVSAKQALALYTDSRKHKLPHLKLLGQLFLDIHQPEEAVQTAKIAIQNWPNDATIAEVLAQAHLAAGQIDEASQAAHFAVALQPNNITLRRNLAKMLETSKAWPQALEEREKIIALQENSNLSDSKRLAECALQAHKPERATEICQKIIRENPDDGEIYLILGKVQDSTENFQEAQENYIKATQYSPDLPVAWLALAKNQENSGDIEKALETLKTASHLLPEDWEIHIAIGEIYLHKVALTQALEAFQKAERLTTHFALTEEPRAKILLALGKTLLNLGHRAKACQVLESIYETHPENPDIAHTYGRTLLALERPKEAILPLTRALEIKPDDIAYRMDYAQALMPDPNNVRKVKEILESVLEIDLSHEVAQALLAEALETSQDWEAALEAYRRAMNTSLRENPGWFGRLSLGLGRTALALNQPETALTAIKQAWLINPKDLQVLRVLSEAYQAANLNDEALQTANSALLIAPADYDNLCWFSRQAVRLNAFDQAISAIEHVLETDPLRMDLLNQLGWVYIQTSDPEAAERCYAQVAASEMATPNELYIASQGLINLHNLKSAIESLERAWSFCKESEWTETSPEKKNIIPKIISSLVAAYKHTENIEASLDTINKGIEVLPEDVSLKSEKASILLEMQNIRGAAVCIDQAIQLSPKDSFIRLQAARIHRYAGDIPKAFTHAQQAIAMICEGEDQTLTLPTNALIADLADAMLQREQARAIIEVDKFNSEKTNSDQAEIISPEHSLDFLAYHCLCGEMALEANEEIAAANALTSAISLDPEHPRVLALQARLTARQGDLDTANQTLLHALKMLGNANPTKVLNAKNNKAKTIAVTCHPATTFISVAEAALLFQQWSVSIFLLQKAVEVAPKEPRSYFRLARALVLRAEHQRLYQVLNVVSHAPGESTLADYAFRQFEEAILEAANLISAQSPESASGQISQPKKPIGKWMARGQAIFQPSKDHAQALGNLEQTSGNQAAYIAALRHAGDLNLSSKNALKTLESVSQKTNVRPILLGQIALALFREQPSAALRAAQIALNLSIKHNLPEQPIYQVILARAAQWNQDSDLLIQSLQAALKVWDDEPKWHELAANLLLNCSIPQAGFTGAIFHLEQAAKLEPSTVSHLLKLGKIHLQTGHAEDAIESLEQAVSISADNSEAWLTLAQSYRMNQDIPQCIRCAKQAAQIDPSKPEANLLLAEIALEVETPTKAEEFVEIILKRNPNHPQALLIHAKTQSALNKPDLALASLDKALLNNPDSIVLQLERIGFVRQTQGETIALQSLQELVSQFPDEPLVLVSLAEALTESGKIDIAIQTAQEALNKSCGNLELPKYIDLLVLLGRLLRGTGQLDQAIHYLEEAVELTTGNANPFIELGRTYQERRQYDLALNQLQKAISTAPDNPQPYYLSGQILKEIKDYPGAEIMLRKAAELAPENLNIHRQLGAVVAINLVHNPQRTNRISTPVVHEL